MKLKIAHWTPVGTVNAYNMEKIKYVKQGNADHEKNKNQESTILKPPRYFFFGNPPLWNPPGKHTQETKKKLMGVQAHGTRNPIHISGRSSVGAQENKTQEYWN